MLLTVFTMLIMPHDEGMRRRTIKEISMV